MEIKLVDAVEPAHFAAMSKLHADGWRATYADVISKDYFDANITDERWIPVFQHNFETGEGYGLIAYDGDIPLSCINFGPARSNVRPDGSKQDMQSDAYAGWGEIQSIYSDPVQTGKGYGHLLIEEALRRLKAAGHAHCFVFVNKDKPRSIHFYEKHGFAPDGTSLACDYDGSICVNLRYVKEL